MSYQSTLTASEHLKPPSTDQSAVFLAKRKLEVNIEFDQLLASVSDSSDESSEEKPCERRRKMKPQIGITRKQLSRKRRPKFEMMTSQVVQRKCSNLNCSFVISGDESAMKKTRYLNELDIYCDTCTNSITKKWTCYFCAAIYTDLSHALENDSYTWICCDNHKCGRWTHVECEERNRNQAIVPYLNDQSYKFYCSDCYSPAKQSSCSMDYPPIVKKRSGSTVLRQEASEGELILSDKADLSLFKKILSSTNKVDSYASFAYSYMYSESYQNADKLSSDKGNQLRLSESDLSKDFEALLNLTGDNRFRISTTPSPHSIPMTDRISNRKKQYKSVLDNKPL